MMDSSKKKKPRQGKKPRRKASCRNGRGTEQRQSRHVNDKKDESQMWWWKSRWIHPKLSSSNPRCLWTIALSVRPNDGSTWRGRLQNRAYEIAKIKSFHFSCHFVVAETLPGRSVGSSVISHFMGLFVPQWVHASTLIAVSITALQSFIV